MNENILGLVYAAIDDVNAQSANGARLEKEPGANLLGGDNGVDSLTFVNLIVAIEEQIQSNLGKSVVLVDEDSMSSHVHPFRTVGTLTDYIETILAKN